LTAARPVARSLYTLLLLLTCAGVTAARETDHAAAPVAITHGTFQERADADQAVPQPYRLAGGEIAYEMGPTTALGRVVVRDVRFPSPVTTPHTENNTVHCEYYTPAHRERPVPAVVVLHILDGRFAVARVFCAYFASRGMAALLLKMPYYGPRRPPGSGLRMILTDIDATKDNIIQAVMDVRRAAAWLAARPGTDPGRISIVGVSLGGFVAALSAGVDRRFHRVVLLLAGGCISHVLWEGEEFAEVRAAWLASGRTREDFEASLGRVDPLRYADRVVTDKVLMVNATRDDAVPREATDALWRAYGKPKIRWVEATHEGAAVFLVSALEWAYAHIEGTPATRPAMSE